jgi:hypothetical protein
MNGLLPTKIPHASDYVRVAIGCTTVLAKVLNG